MGFFDKFKKIEKKDIESEPIKKTSPYDIKYSQFEDGKLEIELVDNLYIDGKFYDTTRLIVKTTPFTMANHPVYNCAVSWYGSDDAKFFNRSTGQFENVDAESYRGILAELDLDLLLDDSKYCLAVMKNLLDKTRVEKYLEDGLKDVPKIPCGKYVGGIKKINDQYKKYFSQDIGLASHESDLMKGRRKELKEKISREREEKIAEKREQILALQKEIDEMEK